MILALALAGALAAPSAAPLDLEYRQALDLVYDGSTDAALERLAALALAHPDDPLAAYLQALALVWKVEQQPDSVEHDRPLQRAVDRAIALADARLRSEPGDARARMARGAAHGVRSRLALFRGHRKEAARAAVRMREELLAARRLAPDNKDVLFGLGLYDYYGDVLPRLVKVMRFFMGLPAGNRERGLALIEEASQGALFHDTEVDAQLYEIYAFYESKPDLALEQALRLRRRYPGAPLWALKLAEHERDRLGLYADSAAVAREIIAACERGHPNYAPVVAAMARVSLGESLLLDLRLAEARRVLLEAREPLPEAAWVSARARLLLGRALELEGDREGAQAHYRIAAASRDRALRAGAEAALAAPIPGEQLRATPLIAEARRLRDGGDAAEAVERYREALRRWPRCHEAALRVAEDELRRGATESARETIEQLAEQQAPQPPWLRPWSLLLRARLRDLAGERERALELYKFLSKEPAGQEAVRAHALAGLRAAYRAEAAAAPPPRRRNHSK